MLEYNSKSSICEGGGLYSSIISYCMNPGMQHICLTSIYALLMQPFLNAPFEIKFDNCNKIIKNQF